MAAVSPSSLKEEFNSSKEMTTRLHYMMAHHEAEENREKFTQLFQIALRLGADLERRAGSSEWTPLEVAVISGYGAV